MNVQKIIFLYFSVSLSFLLDRIKLFWIQGWTSLHFIQNLKQFFIFVTQLHKQVEKRLAMRGSMVWTLQFTVMPTNKQKSQLPTLVVTGSCFTSVTNPTEFTLLLVSSRMDVIQTAEYRALTILDVAKAGDLCDRSILVIPYLKCSKNHLKTLWNLDLQIARLNSF